MVKEIERKLLPGFLMLFVGLLALFGGIALIAVGPVGVVKIAGVLVIMLAILILAGLLMIAPNEVRVLQLFGDYVGTAREPGLRWANPLFTARKISTRIRNFESSKLKVNDKDGSPIEIAAVVVWRVVDTAEAVFEVDDFENYVHVQSESALRNLASQYPYDQHSEGELSLRGSLPEIAEKLKDEVSQRLSKAGVEVIESRISHLAYAAEIAGAMLRRQQAKAIIAARAQIVEGAVSMVHMALEELQKKNVVELDAERKASMVSNLLVVLCSDSEAQPVVNTGTIYQ